MQDKFYYLDTGHSEELALLLMRASSEEAKTLEFDEQLGLFVQTVLSYFEVTFPIQVYAEVENEKLQKIGITPSELERLLTRFDGWGNTQHGLNNITEQSRLIQIVAQELANKVQVLQNLTSPRRLELQLKIQSDEEALHKNFQKIYKALDILSFLLPVVPKIKEIADRANELLKDENASNVAVARAQAVETSMQNIGRSIDVVVNFMRVFLTHAEEWLDIKYTNGDGSPLNPLNREKLIELYTHLFDQDVTADKKLPELLNEVLSKLAA